jgi:hypothetical protein
MNAFGQRINVPDHQRAGSQVIGPLVGQIGFGGVGVVVRAANFSGKLGWPSIKRMRSAGRGPS